MIYFLIGVPGSGKTWVMNHLETYDCVLVRYDSYKDADRFADEIIKLHSRHDHVNIVADIPFGETYIMGKLTDWFPLYIIETPAIVSERYRQREGREIRDSDLSRIENLRGKAHKAGMGCFAGTSEEVLEYLRWALV